ncbi:MAG: histidine kinase [Clostridiales Family XIII bacterium]|jgi:signal transduction histidine kinase|nr:histidine kinase [Clostridiales Family XIII bacterium]
MKEKQIFTSVYQALIAVLSLILYYSDLFWDGANGANGANAANASNLGLMIPILFLSCLILIGLKLLLGLISAPKMISRILIIASIIVAITMQLQWSFPLICLFTMEFLSDILKIDHTSKEIKITIACVIVMFIIIRPSILYLLLSILGASSACFVDSLLWRLIHSNERDLQLNNRMEQITKNISIQKKARLDIEEAARIKERNRIAARIHDEVGHGMSGSVMLLEGVKLQLENIVNDFNMLIQNWDAINQSAIQNNEVASTKRIQTNDDIKQDEIKQGVLSHDTIFRAEQKANQNLAESISAQIVQITPIIELATENLRSSVDDIRLTLREERSDGLKVGLSEIQAVLSKYESEHTTITTELDTYGDLSALSPALWTCVYDNLIEALTNTWKHSQADTFVLSISVKDKLVKVDFYDIVQVAHATNDTNLIAVAQADKQAHGIGLLSMEERCAALGGRFFAENSENGFRITMTFAQNNRG